MKCKPVGFQLKLSGLFICIFFSVTSIKAEGKVSLYMQNKAALTKAVKFYLAYEARHEIGPGSDADLELPEKAQFRVKDDSYIKWVYPVALGLEIKIGKQQRRVVVVAPRSINNRYLIATDDLLVKAYSKKELMPVLAALEKRRKKLTKSPLD